MKVLVWLGLACSATLVVAPSFADDKSACFDAASKGQRLKATHQLIEAREQLRACSAARCPGIVQSDCTRWLEAVETALPTVVVTAKNASGADVVEAKVLVDGQPFADKLDGRAVPIDPGAHTFRLETADGAVDQQVVVPEGEQNQRIAMALRAAAGTPSAPASGDEKAPSTRDSSSPWRTVGWVLGGAGVVGLGFGVGFGVAAINDKNGAHCNSAGQCQLGPLGDARNAAFAADVAFAAGATLLAGGAALVLLAPHASAGQQGGTTAHVRVLPGVGSGALIVDGSW